MPDKVITISYATFKANVDNYIGLSCAGTRVIVMGKDDKVFAVFGRSNRPVGGVMPEDEPDNGEKYGLTGTDGLSWVR